MAAQKSLPGPSRDGHGHRDDGPGRPAGRGWVQVASPGSDHGIIMTPRYHHPTWQVRLSWPGCPAAADAAAAAAAVADDSDGGRGTEPRRQTVQSPASGLLARPRPGRARGPGPACAGPGAAASLSLRPGPTGGHHHSDKPQRLPASGPLRSDTGVAAGPPGAPAAATRQARGGGAAGDASGPASSCRILSASDSGVTSQSR